tara:strand:- start:210 stop:485 length:276 start_codon:yes stop_codon:yes gene_type:complete
MGGSMEKGRLQAEHNRSMDKLLKYAGLNGFRNGSSIPRGTYNFTGGSILDLLTGGRSPIKRCSSAKAKAKFGRGVRDPKIKITRRSRRSPK